MNEEATKYWLSLSLLFAAMTIVLILLQGWLMIIGLVVLIAGMVLITAKHGQFDKNARSQMPPSSSMLPLVAIAFFAVALLVRATEFALYAAPILSVLAGVAVFYTMKKSGLYYAQVNPKQ